MAINPKLYQIVEGPRTIGPQVWSKRSLGPLLLKQDQNVHTGLVHLLAATNPESAMLNVLEGIGTKEVDSDDAIYWDVVTDANHNVALVEARDIDGSVVTVDSGNIGRNTTPFYLVFAEPYFAKGEILEGNMNEYYQHRVLDDPREEGSNYVYKVELMGGNVDGEPAERLLAGERFSTTGVAYVEKSLSRKVGGIRTSTFTRMRNEFTTIRKYMKVGGDMMDAKIKGGKFMAMNEAQTKGVKVRMPVERDGQVKTVTAIVPYLMYIFEKEWRNGKNYALMWSRLNRTETGEYLNIGDSGNAITVGAGIMQQRECGYTKYYTKFSLEAITDALGQLFYGRVPEEGRHVVMYTGSQGLKLFNQAVTDIASGWLAGFSDAAGKFIQSTNSKIHSNSLSFGFQWTKYLAPNGITIEVKLNPEYDNKTKYKILGKDGLPLMSRRFDIFDVGTSHEPNIYMVKIKGGNDITSYQWGLRNPFTGETSNAHMSWDEDSAEIHRMGTTGSVILDPTRTMSFIPAGLLG